MIFPSGIYCICCGSMIDPSRSYSLCDECIRRFHWNTGTTCDKCGKALRERDFTGPRLCYDCMLQPPVFDKGFSCVSYGLHEREIMMDLKYGGKGYIGRICGDMMFDRIEEEIRSGLFSPGASPIDAIVPVPISDERYRERGYNQSAFMASQLAARWRKFVSENRAARQEDSRSLRSRASIHEKEASPAAHRARVLEKEASPAGHRAPVHEEEASPAAHRAPVLYENMLYRTKKTKKLRGLNPAERAMELEGAFKVRDRYINKWAKTAGEGNGGTGSAGEGRPIRVLLIDDIYTTGATANACAHALKEAGIKEVYLLAWASGGNRKPFP